jgi:hypothetical protein
VFAESVKAVRQRTYDLWSAEAGSPHRCESAKKIEIRILFLWQEGIGVNTPVYLSGRSGARRAIRAAWTLRKRVRSFQKIASNLADSVPASSGKCWEACMAPTARAASTAVEMLTSGAA